MTIRVLERTGYRAPLAVLCRDGVSDAVVAGDLVATAWRRDDPTRSYSGRRSPVSGILGWGRLPGTGRSTHAVAAPGEDLVFPTPTPIDFCVRVEDTAGRYLPVIVRTTVPVNAPVAVPLSSAPQRPLRSGMATVRGEVHRDSDDSSLGWALVRVDTGAGVFQTVADDHGRFLLQLPYPEALPPLASPPVGLGAVTWDVTISVRSKPSALMRSPGTRPHDPPELGSVTTQAAAQLIDGGPHPTLTAPLAFGVPLVLALRAVPA
ncbi:hypothetical protein [Nocardioides sp.]|uniref:hypothetical protein n=1 Tax=Nocardioides sp. TaxID=35761 RepID=UPI002C85F9E6|nr:hypothetical protein [Nocardioides sp.]HXH78139.1 hypothetical protein [Nocardioides sp.]